MEDGLFKSSAIQPLDINALQTIGRYMITRHETIAVAESATAGVLQTAFSMAENARNFFQGGITAYNIGQKSRHLRIDPIHAEPLNCVSERVAREMAAHVCDLFSSDWGVGITGYAAEVPEQGICDLFAFYAISGPARFQKAGKIMSPKENTERVQRTYVNQVLRIFSTVLKVQSIIT